MADLTITASDVAPVRTIEQITGPANEAIEAGEVFYILAASGKFALADEDALAPANEPKYVAITSATVANETITGIRKGLIDLGDALDGMDYRETVYLSATAGKMADANPGNSKVVGEVVPAFGATTADKLLRVDL